MKLFVSFVKILLDLEQFSKEKLFRLSLLLLLLVYGVCIYINIGVCVERSGGHKTTQTRNSNIHLSISNIISFSVSSICVAK